MEEAAQYEYFNFSNNKVMYDERKKRFIYLKHAKKQHKRLFNKNHFKTQRPDITQYDHDMWKSDFRDAQIYLKGMMYINKLEIRRLWRTMGQNSYQYMYEIMDDYMTQWRVDGPRTQRLWTWMDASKMVEFYREHQFRCHKYGLDNCKGIANPTKEALKTREDELTEYFLHEMRKKPVE